MAKEKKAKKAVQTAIPRATQEKVGKVKKSSAKFVSLTVRAVIPTQQYGNIQPEITVIADNYNDAREYAMPIIEALYRQYAEAPLSGKEPRFYGTVTETVKEVVPVAATPAAIAEKPAETVVVAPVNTTPKPEPVVKAEKAIALLEDEASALRIQDQIEKSTKIPEEFKPDLIKLCLKKRGEISK